MLRNTSNVIVKKFIFLVAPRKETQCEQSDIEPRHYNFLLGIQVVRFVHNSIILASIILGLQLT